MKKGKGRTGSPAMTRSPAQRAEAPATRPAVSPLEIERRAYELYLLRGGAPGSALEDWLQAERDLRHGS